MPGQVVGGEVRVELVGEAPVDDRAETEAAWANAMATNPRLFDGPMLSFAGWDERAGVISARLDRYKRLAVREAIDPDVLQLGVTLVTRHRDRVLLGLRAHGTRVYGGLWELGPSGGVDVPAGGVGGLGIDDLIEAGAQELEEEAGIKASGVGLTPLAVFEDRIGGSFEVALEARLRDDAAPSGSPANWEYDDVAWVETCEVSAFCSRGGVEVIPPTLALMRHLGWLTP